MKILQKLDLKNSLVGLLIKVKEIETETSYGSSELTK